MTRKWNMIVDIERCNNCRSCFLAVKDEHTGNDFPGYAAEQPPQGHNWLDIERKERGSYPIVDAHFMPVMCNHCDDAPCMKVAKDGAIKKRDDGIVIIDPIKAKGQKQIVDACPYGAVSWNEELQLPQAWIFDAHLLDDGWEKTRAEQVCPTDVLRSVKVSDQEMQKIAAAEGLEVLQPELGAKPRVYYKNMHLFNKCFVSGSVAAMVDGVEECAEGVAFTRLAEDHLYWLMVASRWLDDAWFPHIKAGFFGAMPFPVRHIAPTMARRQVKQTLHLQALGRHTHEEQLGFARRDLDAIAKKVGDGPFLLGEKLTVFDFGIASLIAGTVDNEPATWMTNVVREFQPVVDYTERVQATVGAWCRKIT